MPESDPNEFTDREKFILSYYRSRELSGSRRLLGYGLIVVVASVACIILAMVREELAFGVVGYCLLLGRLLYYITEGGRWTKDFQNIFAKYDSKLEALTDQLRKKQDPDGRA